jgi:hypothetical protein
MCFLTVLWIIKSIFLTASFFLYWSKDAFSRRWKPYIKMWFRYISGVSQLTRHRMWVYFENAQLEKYER